MIIFLTIMLVLFLFVERSNFFSKKELLREIKKQCPEIYITKPKNLKETKSILSNSRFYTVNLEVKSDKEMVESAKLNFYETEKSKVDYSSAYLLTVKKLSLQSAQLRYFTYERYGSLSVENFNNSILEGNDKVTLVFKLKDRPQKIFLIFNGASLTYNIQEPIGNVVYPNIKINNKLNS